MLEETLIFIDGENLATRYQAMVKEGREPSPSNIVFGEYFVWNPLAIRQFMCNVRRVSYYTSVVGDDDRVKQAKRDISGVDFTCQLETNLSRTARIFPIVRKKDKKNKKEGICDVNITVDVMRACYRDHARSIWLFSGDGDFIQLFQEVAHSGKRIFASAFSSGLCDDIPSSVDRFHLLDDLFFPPKVIVPPRISKPRPRKKPA